MGLIGLILLSFRDTNQQKFDIIRAKGIVIEDQNGKDRILIGAPVTIPNRGSEQIPFW